jgi:hypothetical protein
MTVIDSEGAQELRVKRIVKKAEFKYVNNTKEWVSPLLITRVILSISNKTISYPKI